MKKEINKSMEIAEENNKKINELAEENNEKTNELIEVMLENNKELNTLKKEKVSTDFKKMINKIKITFISTFLIYGFILLFFGKEISNLKGNINEFQE